MFCSAALPVPAGVGAILVIADQGLCYRDSRMMRLCWNGGLRVSHPNEAILAMLRHPVCRLHGRESRRPWGVHARRVGLLRDGLGVRQCQGQEG